MKKIYFYLLIILVGQSCTKQNSVYGHWKLERISGETLSSDEKNTVYQINENGSLIRHISGRKGSGIWKKNDQIIEFQYDDRREKFTIAEWNAEHLIIVQDQDSFYFSKTSL